MQINTGEQLKGYLQRESKAQKMHSNAAYNYYFCRSFLERLYEKNDKFVLKGSFAQFNNIEVLKRPLTDIDIVSFDNIKRASQDLEKTIAESNFIKFKITKRFVTTNSTINYRVLCKLDRQERTISFDLRHETNDEIITKPLPKVFSSDNAFDVTSINLEEHLANKLYVIILHLNLHLILGREYRRFKDFYDVYTMLESGKFNEAKVMYLLDKKLKEDNILAGYIVNFDKSLVNEFLDKHYQDWHSDSLKYAFSNPDIFSNSVNETIDFISNKSK